jgi:hypothetical protein
MCGLVLLPWLWDRTRVVGLSVAHALGTFKGARAHSTLYTRGYICLREASFFFKSFSWPGITFLKIDNWIILSTCLTHSLSSSSWVILTANTSAAGSFHHVYRVHNITITVLSLIISWLIVDYLCLLGHAFSLTWQQSSFSPLFPEGRNGKDTLHFGLVGYTNKG